MRKLLAFAIAFLALLPAIAATRYSETLIVKETGSQRALVLSAASVFALSPGATANCATTCSGTTVTVFSSANISPGDTVEVGSTGLQATVLTVPLSTTFTINTSVTWRANDRFLRVSSPITIYADELAGTTITQPTTTDTNGRVVFFVDTNVTQQFDVKAVAATGGYRYVNPGQTLAGTGASAGGWTDAGTEVNLTTSSDNVNVGGTGGLGKIRVYADSSNLYTAANPAKAVSLYATANAFTWGWFLASNGMSCLNNGTKTILCVDDGPPQAVYIGDMATIDLVAPGVINARPQIATQRGLVVEGFTLQSANLTEWRDSLNNVLASVGPAGGFTVPTLASGPLTASTGTFSGALQGLTVTSLGAITATTSVNGATLVVTGTTTIRGVTYTWPTTSTTGGILRNTSGGASVGTLSWSASAVSECAGIAHYPFQGPTGTTAPSYLDFIGFDVETALPNFSQWNTTSSCTTAAGIRVPAAIGVKNLVGYGPVTTTTTTVTIMKNCADTALSCTIAASGDTCTDSDLVSFAAGDVIHVKMQNSSSAGGMSDFSQVSWCWVN